MRCEVINIRTVSNDEYRDISARQSDELKKRLENCGEDDVKRTLAGRLLLERMIKRIYGKERFEIISLVCGGELKEKLEEYRFETEKTESYYLAVCCK